MINGSETRRAKRRTRPERLSLIVEGMDCAQEVGLLRRALSSLVGEEEDRLAFDVVGGRLWVTKRDDAPTVNAVIAAIATTGMRASVPQKATTGSKSVLDSRQRLRVALTVTAGVGALGGVAFDALLGSGLASALGLSQGEHVVGWAARICYAETILVAFWHVAPRAWSALRRMRPDMNLLMTVAVIGAVVIGEWLEAAAVSFLFALSLTLEGWSASRARHAIDAVLRLAPDRVCVIDAEGVEEVMLPDDVEIGAHFVVRPGERVPLDGTVIEGASRLDESPITGESVPVVKCEADDVFAGTINGDGALVVESTHVAGDTVLARVVKLTAEARADRAPVERWVDRFAAVYTPIALFLALLVALVPPLVLGLDWEPWVYRALVLLVIACPCALVISTPVTLISALAAAARNGVLIKGSSHLEVLAKTRAVALDKTGTLTEGRPRVVEVHALRGTADQALSLAASVEARSEHPLARAIVLAAEQRGLRRQRVRRFQALPGKGARAVVQDADAGNRPIWVGSHPFVEELRLETPEMHAQMEELARGGLSVVLVGTDEEVLGMIALEDGLRAESVAAIESLRRCDIAHVSLLTGDNRETAIRIGERCGIEDVRAELLPHEKLSAIQDLVAEHEFVAMVGDGVNDAPALARASVGIAMGAAGSDAAIETADVALMADDLRKLPWLIEHARRALRTVRTNVAISLAVKAAVVVLAVLGYTSLWAAIAADMGASLVVTLNGLALLRARTPKGTTAPKQSKDKVPGAEPHVP